MFEQTNAPTISWISPEDVHAAGVQLRADIARMRDLDRVAMGDVIDRRDALTMAVRLVGREDITTDERAALRTLMTRHNLTRGLIVVEWRRVTRARFNTWPPAFVVRAAR